MKRKYGIFSSRSCWQNAKWQSGLGGWDRNVPVYFSRVLRYYLLLALEGRGESTTYGVLVGEEAGYGT